MAKIVNKYMGWAAKRPVGVTVFIDFIAFLGILGMIVGFL